MAKVSLPLSLIFFYPSFSLFLTVPAPTMRNFVSTHAFRGSNMALEFSWWGRLGWDI